jgi:hypothetical protein
MSKIQKTFNEGEDVAEPLNWFDARVWAHTNTIKNRDPAEWKYELANKIKITIEIYGTSPTPEGVG